MTQTDNRIEGQVVNAQTGSPMGGVTVTISPQVFLDQAQTQATTTLVTDGLGRFVAWAPPAVYSFTTSEPKAAPIPSVTILASDASPPITYQPVQGPPGTPGAPGGVASVNGLTGAVVIDKTTVGLPNVDNTADTAKPVSALQAAADSAAQAAAQAYADANKLQLPTGSASVGNVPTVTGTGPLVLGWTTPAGGSSLPADAAGWLHDNGSGGFVWSTPTAADVGAPPTSRQVIAGQGLTGGGTLAADRTLAVAYGTTAGTAAQGNDSRIVNALSGTRQVIAGSGLAGGGALTADVTVARAPAAGYLATNYDPVLAASSTRISAAGVLTVVALNIPVASTITAAAIYLSAFGATLTSGQNLIGLYDSSGALVRSTADQTSAWGGGSLGMKTINFTSTYSAAAGSYYAVILSRGTTAPGFGETGSFNSAALLNGNATGANLRFATYSTGLTALPATITLSSLVAGTSAYFVGLQ